MTKFLRILIIVLFILNGRSYAQDLSNPGQYLAAIGNAYSDMNKKYMAYMSAVAHSGRARKIEKLRQQTVENIQNSKYKVSDLPLFKGDNTLRKSSMDYIQLCYNVFNEDYGKIVNMEEIIEQSFDEMQAYLLLQEKTSEKLQIAADLIQQATKSFAAKYNVNLVEAEKSELSEKMEIAAKLNHYRNQVYLIFFKCNWQDGQITNAINAKKLNNLEQSRNALISYANEGLAVLDTLHTFNGDGSLAQGCRQALLAYKKIAENELPKQIDFFLKEENFNKIKKNMEAKATPSKADVDAYNKSVAEMNSAVNTMNAAINNMNQMRTNALKNWVDAEKNFLDTNMPHYK